MTVSAPRRPDRRRRAWLLGAPALGAGLLLLSLLLLGPSDAGGARVAAPADSGAPAARPPSSPSGQPGPAWGQNVKASVIFQHVVDRLPEGAPYVMRVTELEMEPGARIFEHRQLGVGAHVVVQGAIAIEDVDANHTSTYRAGQAYFEGLEPLHRAENPGAQPNRVLLVDILPASRKFDGTQQFTARGRHNAGEIRSGPYVQVPLAELPAEPLMFRVSEMSFGPKAKTVEHTRLGPTIFFVQEGTAHVRKDWNNSSMTYGTNGYLYESGREPFILENTPAAPARLLAVELLPASVGDGPSTVPTGRGGGNDPADD